MLNTLLRIGKWQSQGKSEWDRFLEKPKVVYEDKNGNPIRNYILPIIFDLDEGNVIVDAENLIEYDERYLKELLAIKLLARNGKAIYTTVEPKGLNQIYKTFFGKENKEVEEGELSESLKRDNPKLFDESLGELLKQIFHLKEKFLEKVIEENEKTGEKLISPKPLLKQLELTNNQALVQITIKVKCKKHFGETNKSFAEIEGYKSFIESKLFENKGEKAKSKPNASKNKLCYASGLNSTNVESLNLNERYSLNKMFVEETKNYASLFDKNKFSMNYQVSQANQELLDFASNYLLNEGNLKTKIANVDHIIIPQFLENEDIDFDLALRSLKTKSDLLFSFDTLENFSKEISDEVSSIYWINFLAYESDGNFFKSTELIKDVSSFHFQKIISAFSQVHWEYKTYPFFDWDNVMTEYGKKGGFFNFNTIYLLIPLRKDKEKKNKALSLFKAILENRKVNRTLLYSYFSELILCHYYQRYKSYTNIHESSLDYFSKTIRDSVFKYHAFVQVLKNLKLIDMSEETNMPQSDAGNKYDQAINDFFEKMQLNQPQQAMFYLGRMLNAVEFIQKGKKKTVIEKVNFNGMDRDDIQRLRISLIEKAKQYSKVGKVVFTDRKFGELFDFNQWNMNPQEAVFFLLTGYSFGISTTEAKAIEEDETDIEN